MTHQPTTSLWAVVLESDVAPNEKTPTVLPCFCFFEDPDQRNTRIYATPDRGLAEYAAGKLRGMNPSCVYDTMELVLVEPKAAEGS